MTWQPNEHSPHHLDPRDVEGAPPAGSGSGQFIESTEGGAIVPDDSRGRLTEAASGAERDAAVRYPSKPGEPIQTEPVEDGALDATDEQKIAGIVAQTQQDLELGNARTARELLAQRFEQSRIAVDEHRLGVLAASLQRFERHGQSEHGQSEA